MCLASSLVSQQFSQPQVGVRLRLQVEKMELHKFTVCIWYPAVKSMASRTSRADLELSSALCEIPGTFSRMANGIWNAAKYSTVSVMTELNGCEYHLHLVRELTGKTPIDSIESAF
eukprot:6489331-Amphidinium_carterae.2